jgi:hypothetical protein
MVKVHQGTATTRPHQVASTTTAVTMRMAMTMTVNVAAAGATRRTPGVPVFPGASHMLLVSDTARHRAMVAIVTSTTHVVAEFGKVAAGPRRRRKLPNAVPLGYGATAAYVAFGDVWSAALNPHRAPVVWPKVAQGVTKTWVAATTPLHNLQECVLTQNCAQNWLAPHNCKRLPRNTSTITWVGIYLQMLSVMCTPTHL